MSPTATRSGLAFGCLLAWATVAEAAPLSAADEASAEQAETTCRIVAQEQSLSGRALDASVSQCVAQENPAFAYWEQCRQSARHRHLKGAALRGAVAYCMSREL